MRIDQKIINKIKSVIFKIDERAELILFGSKARGDWKQFSDWDFLILTSFPINEKKKGEIRDQLFKTEIETGQIFSTLIHSKNDWIKYKITPLYKNIKKEGIRL